MLNNDFTRSDSRRGHKCPFTSVVILQKESTGIVHACPVSDVNMIGSRTCSVNSSTKRLPSNVIVLGRSYRMKHPLVVRLATMPEYWFETLNVQSDLQESTKREQCKLGQRSEEQSPPVLVTSAYSAKGLNKVLGMLLTAGGILLITKHKRLIGLATSLGGLFITAMTVSKK